VSRELRERLRRAVVPGAEDAERRAWQVVRQAAAGRPAAPRTRARGVLVLAAVAAAAGVVLSGAAAAPAEWALDRLDLRPAAEQGPARTPLPAAGKLLIQDRGRLAVVTARGRRTPLGRWHGGAWSPRGRFVVAWRGRRLAALTPAGELRWELRAPGVVQGARWSPDGFRIAFRTADGALRVVNGDGTGARQLARVHGVAMAWRPGAPHTLAWARPDGTLAVRDVDTLALAEVVAPRLPPDTAELSFSASGRHLLAWSVRDVVVADLRSGRRTAVAAGRGAVLTGAAFAPRGRGLALARLRDGRDGVLTVRGRDVFVGHGELQSIAWAPDGSAVAAGWPAARQVVAVGLRTPGVSTLPSGLPLGWSR
jgi:hypothetical protein